MTVQSNSLDLSVFGTAQVDYSVGSESGLTYDQVVARMGLRRSTAIEDTIPVYTTVIKQRQSKAEDLGNVLATIATAVASRGSDDSIDKKTNIGSSAYSVLEKYGLLSSGLATNGDITYANLQTLQTDVQYAIDVNNNDLQQDAASLQSLVQKRDNAYSMATKLMKKASQTRATGIKYIG